MRKTALGLICLVALSACADGRGQVLDPRYRFDSATGYDQYRATREVALTGRAPAPQTVPMTRPFEAPTPEMIQTPTLWERVRGTTTGVAQAATAPIRGNRAPKTGGAYVDPATGKRLPSARVPVKRAAPVAVVAPVTAPVAVTTTPGVDLLATYAMGQQHPMGMQVYARSGGSAVVASQACAAYAEAGQAQLAFLAQGGPQLDPLGLDPDGDGYVCGWEPGPYRQGAM